MDPLSGTQLQLMLSTSSYINILTCATRTPILSGCKLKWTYTFESESCWDQIWNSRIGSATDNRGSSDSMTDSVAVVDSKARLVPPRRVLIRRNLA